MYISGPMTGYFNENRAEFARAAAWLRAWGHDVVSPAEIVPAEAGATWEDCLRLDLAALVTCEAIALLRGWPQSPGARLELTEALALGLRVYAILEPERGDELLGATYHLEDLNHRGQA
jgi:hypothetical protein